MSLTPCDLYMFELESDGRDGKKGQTGSFRLLQLDQTKHSAAAHCAAELLSSLALNHSHPVLCTFNPTEALCCQRGSVKSQS